MIRGKRLAAKPNGFTNLRFDPTGEPKYRAQRRIISQFNTLNYPGSRNTALTPTLDTSRAHVYTAANLETDWDPPSRKRVYISRVESKHTIQKTTKVEIKAEEDDYGEETFIIGPTTAYYHWRKLESLRLQPVRRFSFVYVNLFFGVSQVNSRRYPVGLTLYSNTFIY